MLRTAEVSRGEFNALKALWRVKRGTVADVRAQYEEIPSSKVAYTTVMTLLTRLAAKGMVHVDRERQPFCYSPAQQERTVVHRRLRQFIDAVFDGDASQLVLSLLTDEALTTDDLRRLERKVDAASPPKRGRR